MVYSNIITLWPQSDFDLLLQEAERCDRTFQQIRSRTPSQDAVVQVFFQLILQGKMEAAVCWATERARGIVLLPCDQAGGYTDGSTVFDELSLEHPDSCITASASFLHCDVSSV